MINTAISRELTGLAATAEEQGGGVGGRPYYTGLMSATGTYKYQDNEEK